MRGRGRRGLDVLRPKYRQAHARRSADPQAVAGKTGTGAGNRLSSHVRGQVPRSGLVAGEGPRNQPGGGSSSRILRNRLLAVLGIIAMRRGEIENCLECVGPSSCIFPIAPEAVHRNQAGSREAIRWFTAYLHESPRDLRIIWLLNIAYMTLGEHPDKVPPEFLLPASLFRSKTRRRPVRECCVTGRPDHARTEPGRRKYLRRLHRRRLARPFHHVARRRPGSFPVRQPR